MLGAQRAPDYGLWRFQTRRILTEHSPAYPFPSRRSQTHRMASSREHDPKVSPSIRPTRASRLRVEALSFRLACMSSVFLRAIPP